MRWKNHHHNVIIHAVTDVFSDMTVRTTQMRRPYSPAGLSRVAGSKLRLNHGSFAAIGTSDLNAFFDNLRQLPSTDATAITSKDNAIEIVN
jgi:hypothetical protein